jgi:Leucine-rich repeat (LRR) protein
LRTLDLSRNTIQRLRGLENLEHLKFLNLSLNNISKVRQSQYIENLATLTELDLCYNPIQNKKYFRMQMLFHIPQLRMLDGVNITSEEKIKAENLHGFDQSDRELIFQSLLPDEQFVDRRLQVIEDVELESDSETE